MYPIFVKISSKNVTWSKVRYSRDNTWNLLGHGAYCFMVIDVPNFCQNLFWKCYKWHFLQAWFDPGLEYSTSLIHKYWSMHTLSGESYSENASSGIFYKPGLTQAWNIVHQSTALVHLVPLALIWDIVIFLLLSRVIFII